MKTMLTPLLLTILLLACQPTGQELTDQEMTEAARAAVEEEVLSTVNALWDAAESLEDEEDLDAIWAFIAYDEDFWQIRDTNRLSPTQYRQLFEGAMDEVKGQRMYDREFRVDVLTPEIALVQASARVITIRRDGEPGDSLRVVGTELWKKSADGWKVTHTHGSFATDRSE